MIGRGTPKIKLSAHGDENIHEKKIQIIRLFFIFLRLIDWSAADRKIDIFW